MKAVSLLLGVSLLVGPFAMAQAREPSEQEMLSAMERRLSGAKQGQAAQGSEGCERMRQSQNPMDAMACAMFGSEIGAAARNIEIAYFEKLSCEKSREPGYVCDYLINVNAPMMGGFNPRNRPPTSGTKRFIQSKTGWLAVDR